MRLLRYAPGISRARIRTVWIATGLLALLTAAPAQTPTVGPWADIDKRSDMYPGGPHANEPTFALREFKQAYSYRNDAGSLVSSVKHVLRVSVDTHIVNDPVAFNGAANSDHDYTNSPPYNGQYPDAANIQIGMTCPQSVASYVYVVTPSGSSAEMGKTGANSTTPVCADVPLDGVGETAPGVLVPVVVGDTATPQVVADDGGTSTSGQVVCVVKYVLDYWKLDGFHQFFGHWEPNEDDPHRYWVDGYRILLWGHYEDTVYRKYLLDVAKNVCIDASIDSRKAFGQPNTQGELPGDPNAPQRPVNFGAWDYQGGLFVGTVPYLSTGDQSGVARLQLVNDCQGQGTFLGALLTLVPLSVHDDANHSFDTAPVIGLYAPHTNDDGWGLGETEMRWDNRWNVNPHTGNDPTDYSRQPILAITVVPSYTANYLNYPIGALNIDLSHLCLALAYEPEKVADANYKTWVYFASKEYSQAPSGFPAGDLGPKLWRLGLVGGVSKWSVTTTL